MPRPAKAEATYPTVAITATIVILFFNVNIKVI
jgi:hypothetical protein